MKKTFHQCFAHLVLVLLIAGCGSDDSGSASANEVPTFSGGGSQGASSENGVADTSSSGGSNGTPSGTVDVATNPTPAGSDDTAGSGATNLDTGEGKPSTSGSEGTDVSAGGSGGATNSGAGGSSAGGVARTVELIGPGTARCGATNATHGDGFVCVLNYPSEGPNVVGYWFDYAFSANTCNLGFTKPAGNDASDPQICFSGDACPATSGGGLGVALCDVHGIDVSTWPQLESLEVASSLSSTLKSPFSGCNPGAALTSISWTLGSGSIPAGTSVLFDDAADVNVARVDNLAAGTTSVDMPANVDASTVASIKFSVSGASSASWNFCLTSVTVSMR